MSRISSLMSARGQTRPSRRYAFTSASPLGADVIRFGYFFRKVPKVDINCRDCDVRSLAEPEPDRHVFAKFKHLLCKAAARSAETICVTIGEILRRPTECANYFRNSGYAQS